MMAPGVQQVMRQARARVFGGDTHVESKLVSVFEPATEVIRKGKASKPIRQDGGDPGSGESDHHWV
jgi:IS5 family transposase